MHFIITNTQHINIKTPLVTVGLVVFNQELHLFSFANYLRLILIRVTNLQSFFQSAIG